MELWRTQIIPKDGRSSTAFDSSSETFLGILTHHEIPHHQICAYPYFVSLVSLTLDLMPSLYSYSAQSNFLLQLYFLMLQHFLRSLDIIHCCAQERFESHQKWKYVLKPPHPVTCTILACHRLWACWTPFSLGSSQREFPLLICIHPLPMGNKDPGLHVNCLDVSEEGRSDLRELTH